VFSPKSQQVRDGGADFATQSPFSLPTRMMAAASPQITARIESSLAALKPNEWLCVDTTGKVHHDKKQFITGEAQVLATFTRQSDNSFKVENCLPPRNETFCGSGEIPKRVDEVSKLEFVTTLNSGDWIALTPRLVARVPSEMVKVTESPAEQLAYLLCVAPLGEPLPLGRTTIPNCPIEVSRTHVTAVVQSREVQDDGKLNMQVRICLGIPTNESVRIVWPDGHEEEVHGAKQVNGGVRVRLGELLGTVTIPHPPNSVEEAGQSVYESLSEGVNKAERALLTFAAAEDRGAFTMWHQNDLPAISVRQDVRQAIVANSMEAFCREGLALIRAGDFERATAHFEKPEVFKLAGYNFEVNNVIELDRLTENDILENLHLVASRSWFYPDSKMIYPSVGILREGLVPRNDHERTLLTKWRRELALVYAEETTHGRQHYTGGLVSKRARLIEHLPQPHEADIAAFFFEQGVNLSYDFMKNRYATRALAFEILKGYQTPNEEIQLLSMFRGARFGQAVVIGRDPRSAGSKLVFPIDKIPSDENVFTSATLHRRIAAQQALRREEVIISRRQDGRIDIAPASSLAEVFIPDDRGYYSKLKASTVLEPGTPIYIGKSFKFNLS
jgi:hypothetical protein